MIYSKLFQKECSYRSFTFTAKGSLSIVLGNTEVEIGQDYMELISDYKNLHLRKELSVEDLLILSGIFQTFVEEPSFFEKAYSFKDGLFFYDSRGRGFCYKVDGVSFAFSTFEPSTGRHHYLVYHLLYSLRRWLLRRKVREFRNFSVSGEGFSYRGYLVEWYRCRGMELDSLFSFRGVIKEVSFGDRLIFVRDGGKMKVLFDGCVVDEMDSVMRNAFKEFLYVGKKIAGYSWL